MDNTEGVQSDDANVTLTMTREALNLLVLRERGSRGWFWPVTSPTRATRWPSAG